MDIKLTLENKQLYPAVINLRQFSNNTDIIKVEMPDYMYETTDLSTMNCYAVCDMGGKIDEVKLETEVVEDKLKITWKVTGYTTQQDGHINYLIAFKDIENEESVLWFSYQGIIFVNSSINADDYIAAKYPSILQQWEERMNGIHDVVKIDVEEIRNAVETTNKNAVDSKNSADSAERAEENANKALSNISELLGYEPVEAIDMEVMQARGTYDLLGLRLDAIEADQTEFKETTQETIDNHKQEVTDYVNQKLSGVYKYRGSVSTKNDLPTTGNENGDVWNVEDTGNNYAWEATKNEWDCLAGIVDLSVFYNKNEIDTKLNLKQKKITYGTSEPSGGSDGDIYIQIEG